MAQKVCKCGVKKQEGWFYFLDDQGDVARIELENIENKKEYETIKTEYESIKAKAEEIKKKKIENEERERLSDKKIRYEIRKKLLEEEFKDMAVNGRQRIPEEVRHEVWRRDGGKCAKCGGRENLEFDHVIPLSEGGSNTVRNIELLCEKCNREKSNNI